MSLEGYEVWLIIILVLGVIASNLAVLKYSAKFKMPQFGDPKDNKAKPQTNDSEELASSKHAADTKADNDKKPDVYTNQDK
ncbi:DUF2897 family protein [Shewanella inventionis]|uniref:DUF2897 family protein n=1 Tax=Shewanella inventionis TaxID=1738770 RepID=A0ABQ1J4K9_9GAMM|nr:DUF2897 family protein [Shewanella inventionis]MCL1157401.1 DUF2897 family protein [Shewanella inventionis]UAL42048.1 DUF2897 family protein [Shewanella inventionis]GGB58565.1 hypothetical protein GCM10011607_18980 [Shewanella inventionis]